MKKTAFRVAALVLFAALFASNTYRAATQSLVHDEALTWQLYLAGPASMIFRYFDANNHFLATVLFRISTTLFGESEFAIRLPTLLSGAWFFWTLFRLCELVLGEGWLFLLGCASVALNPILLDFLVAARGYGLAIASLFWALYEMLAWWEAQSQGADAIVLRKRLWKAALGCSIAVAANLTLLMPVVILAAAFCFLILRAIREPAAANSAGPQPPKARKKPKKSKPDPVRRSTRSYAALMHFVVPVIACAVLYLLAAPIDMARGQDFYAGLPSALASLRNLIEVSFAYGGGFGVLRTLERIWREIALVFIPAAVIAALAVAWIPRGKRPLAEVATWLSSLAVIGSAVLLWLAHASFGLLYPEDRTGIYFVPLATFAALGLVRILSQRPGVSHWIGIATAVVLASFAIEFAAQWNVKSFWVWRYDADTKRIFQALEAAPKPPGTIRLGVSWVLEPSLNYYRTVRNATWMATVERDGFDGPRQFYVAIREDQHRPRWRKARQIYRGPVSGTALAVPQSAQ